MPRPSQEGKILEAALQCFADNGYDGTRIKHIAEKAGVSEGAIYRHYESKEAIAQALYTLHLGAYSTNLQIIAASTLSVKERMQKFVQYTLDNYRENPAAFNYVLLRLPAFHPNLPEGFIYPVEIVERLISEGQKEGVVRGGRPNLLAAIFLGCVLRPIIVSIGSVPGALDLLNETEHDQLIIDAAWRAISG